MIRKPFYLLFSLFLLLALGSFSAEAADKVVKILAIGNSFSEDAIEQNFYELAEADGIQVIVANLYHPGCSLERHANNIHNDIKDYNYRKVMNGVMVKTPDMTIDKALADEDWDYVSLQQASHFSGQFQTYNPYVSELFEYVKAHVKPSAKIMFHMTWAYAKDSNHDGFKNYDRSQSVMYKAITDAAGKVMKQLPFDILIPSGTAIQNARTSKLGDTLNRDGYHLNLLYGRYTAACTWFEAIFGRSVVGNAYAPVGISEYQRLIAQHAAHEAVKKPLAVTDLQKVALPATLLPVR